MNNGHFYDIIDSEIDSLIKTFKNNEYLKKQDQPGKKSFGFLLWFLKRYLPHKDLTEIENYIVDGDDDNSCDLIFENYDNSDELIYYVVQAKWFKKSNINNANKMAKEIKACLSDFQIILSGKKDPTTRNDRFNERYKDFIEHKKENGKIKFIFLSLCKEIEGADDNINEFMTSLVRFEKFDIYKLKKQYIELTYKGIKTHNPIETPYLPKSLIELGIIKDRNIKLPKPSPYEAHIFLVKPSEIFLLFEKFGLSIFYKNIRNPLPRSLYNDKIVHTIKHDPLNFWYFNNGITAITDEIKDFHTDTEKITIKGIQVINGAQTVYSIYSAFRDANEAERKKMDSDTLISFRILRSGGENFDLLVTKYTNSQNPIDERDFHSNDDVQKNLQEEFIRNTNIWYETRRGEFIKKTKFARIISNERFGQAYLAYFLQDPFSAKTKRRMIFISKNENKDGLYEEIFNVNTEYKDLLISLYIFMFIDRKRKEFSSYLTKIEPDENGNYSDEDEEIIKFDFIQYSTFELVALYYIFLTTVLGEIREEEYRNKLILQYEKNNLTKYEEIYSLLKLELEKFISDKKLKNLKFRESVYFKNRNSYLELKKYISSILASPPHFAI